MVKLSSIFSRSRGEPHQPVLSFLAALDRAKKDRIPSKFLHYFLLDAYGLQSQEKEDHMESWNSYISTFCLMKRDLNYSRIGSECYHWISWALNFVWVIRRQYVWFHISKSFMYLIRALEYLLLG